MCASIVAPNLNAEKKPEALQIKIQTGATQVWLPVDYKVAPARKLEFQSRGYKLAVFASQFERGVLAYLEIYPEEQQVNDSLKVRFAGRLVALSKHKFGKRGLIGISPALKPGKQALIIQARVQGKSTKETFWIPIKKNRFPVYQNALNLGEYSNQTKPLNKKTIQWIVSASKKKALVFGKRTEFIPTARLAHPRNVHKITSQFYASRITQRFRIKNGKRIILKPKRRIHRGLDLYGETGAPVFAMLDGQVAIAEHMYYEGNVVFLDHGHGLLSVYMHMNRITVRPGQKVIAGQRLGDVGATGAVTGAHLHVAIYDRGMPLHPLSILALPLRD